MLAESASPLIWKILRRQLGGRSGDTQAADLEDLHGDLLLKLQLQLAAARRGERPAPSSFLDYVAASAFNAVAAFHLARQPERTRLRDRVRYVLRREGGLASWTSSGRDLVCGLASHAGRAADGRLLARLAAAASEHAAHHGGGWGRLPRLVVAILETVDEPCRFEDLVDALAGALGVEESAETAAVDESRHRREAPPATREANAADRLTAIEGVARVWEEIVQLPRNQRFALLMNLRGEGGEGLLEELLATGVVDRDRLAEALELAASELAALLPELPRDDRWIAERLGLSRQQVINLRKSARLRLARRLRLVLGPVG